MGDQLTNALIGQGLNSLSGIGGQLSAYGQQKMTEQNRTIAERTAMQYRAELGTLLQLMERNALDGGLRDSNGDEIKVDQRVQYFNQQANKLKMEFEAMIPSTGAKSAFGSMATAQIGAYITKAEQWQEKGMDDSIEQTSIQLGDGLMTALDQQKLNAPGADEAVKALTGELLKVRAVGKGYLPGVKADYSVAGLLAEVEVSRSNRVAKIQSAKDKSKALESEILSSEAQNKIDIDAVNTINEKLKTADKELSMKLRNEKSTLLSQIKERTTSRDSLQSGINSIYTDTINKLPEDISATEGETPPNYDQLIANANSVAASKKAEVTTDGEIVSEYLTIDGTKELEKIAIDNFVEDYTMLVDSNYDYAGARSELENRLNNDKTLSAPQKAERLQRFEDVGSDFYNKNIAPAVRIYYDEILNRQSYISQRQWRSPDVTIGEQSGIGLSWNSWIKHPAQDAVQEEYRTKRGKPSPAVSVGNAKTLASNFYDQYLRALPGLTQESAGVALKAASEAFENLYPNASDAIRGVFGPNSSEAIKIYDSAYAHINDKQRNGWEKDGEDEIPQVAENLFSALLESQAVPLFFRERGMTGSTSVDMGDYIMALPESERQIALDQFKTIVTNKRHDIEDSNFIETMTNFWTGVEDYSTLNEKKRSGVVSDLHSLIKEDQNTMTYLSPLLYGTIKDSTMTAVIQDLIQRDAGEFLDVLHKKGGIGSLTINHLDLKRNEVVMKDFPDSAISFDIVNGKILYCVPSEMLTDQSLNAFTEKAQGYFMSYEDILNSSISGEVSDQAENGDGGPSLSLHRIIEQQNDTGKKYLLFMRDGKKIKQYSKASERWLSPGAQDSKRQQKADAAFMAKLPKTEAQKKLEKESALRVAESLDDLKSKTTLEGVLSGENQ